MALKIRPRKEFIDGDGFQFKPEKIRVADKNTTTQLQATITKSEIKIYFLRSKQEDFVKVVHIPHEQKISLKSEPVLLTIISIAITAISIAVTLIF